ncbi:hypothetical protein [Mesorhizobium sp.]|uniref:hypothetical protein n=1 Tax=Mesorhizobium sp. TaxID=1871066 RepID=UPI0025C6272B|nr:hypothetical protein [Mesorhizobium sp.]
MRIAKSPTTIAGLRSTQIATGWSGLTPSAAPAPQRRCSVAPAPAPARHARAPAARKGPVMLDQVRATAELLSAEPAIMVVGPPLGAKDEPGTHFLLPFLGE